MNPTLRAEFDEKGYAIAKGVYDPTEIAALEEDFDRIVKQLLDSGESINARWTGPEMDRLDTAALQVLHTHNVQQYSARWLQAMLHPRFLQAATELLGPDIILHHSKLFQKPSETGAPFPMHQDWTYFPTIHDTMLAGIVHVSRADDEMGCLRVYPGSHKLGRVEDTSGQRENEVLSQYPLEGATPLEAEPGDVVFFSYLTIHGSLPNRSNEVRKTVLVQLHAGSDKVEDLNQHPNEQLVLAGWNHHARRGSVNM